MAALLASAASAAAANVPMPVLNATTQPVGHYDFCKRYSDECGRNVEVGVIKLSTKTWNKIAEVNDAVNISIFPRTDEDMFGVAEIWSYPKTEGDCEDYALLKQYMLQRAGFPRSALLITVVRQPNGDGHAVLTVRTDKGDYILDNLQDGVLDWDRTEYRYLKRQSEKNSGKWLAIGDDRDVLVGSVR
ncbi:transglutaminase-like cysteine peptidase [Aureimonas sp. Leaf454]|uniref:transglutaminase-like cysteine peptidase n=1 Tax=Aureimonas sp. Leaf454 TaxID=1736381 RepID=UPI001FCE1279|nr:transglutaminase-like cysteine peptidase [Aureimonas sp. Leaf454]